MTGQYIVINVFCYSCSKSGRIWLYPSSLKPEWLLFSSSPMIPFFFFLSHLHQEIFHDFFNWVHLCFYRNLWKFPIELCPVETNIACINIGCEAQTCLSTWFHRMSYMELPFSACPSPPAFPFSFSFLVCSHITTQTCWEPFNSFTVDTYTIVQPHTILVDSIVLQAPPLRIPLPFTPLLQSSRS